MTITGGFKAITALRKRDTNGNSFITFSDGDGCNLKAKGLASLNDATFDAEFAVYLEKFPQYKHDHYTRGAIVKAGVFLGYVYVQVQE